MPPKSRSAALLLILVGELSWLSVRFDAASVGAHAGWTARLMNYAPLVPRVAIAIAVAWLILAGPRLKRLGHDFLNACRRHTRWWQWLLCHLAAFGTLAFSSYMVFERPSPHVSTRDLQVALWWILVITSLVSWLAAVAPAGFWWSVIQTERRTLFAAAIVGMAACQAGQWAQALWGPLSDPTLALLEKILGGVVDRVISLRAARVIGTQTFAVKISPQCSGYEGLGLICVLLGAFLTSFHRRLRFPQAWLLWPLGVLAIWLLNVARISALVLLGIEYSPRLCVGGFHSQLGWLFFNVAALGMMATALRLRFFARPDRLNPMSRPNDVAG